MRRKEAVWDLLGQAQYKSNQSQANASPLMFKYGFPIFHRLNCSGMFL